MERKDYLKERDLLHKLGGFSKSIFNNHHLDNLSEFVLHDLCSQNLFNISKAAYFINNPDFSCMKGIVGYYHPESFSAGNSWDTIKDFSSHMQQSNFNKKVRSIYDKSIVFDKNGSEKKNIYNLADQLEIVNPMYHVWNAKYDNQGLLIFETPQDNEIHEHIERFMPILSFCSVF